MPKPSEVAILSAIALAGLTEDRRARDLGGSVHKEHGQLALAEWYPEN